ncbi:MAG: hypothetical protein ACI4CT_03560 [Lachnospiraceae bacterium]
MENSLTGLMMAAGTIVTCMIISIGFFLARQGQRMATSTYQQMEEIQTDIEEQQQMQYHQAYVIGSEVINCIRHYQEEYEIVVVTKTQTNRFPVSDFSVVYQIDNRYYINPAGKYYGIVLRDANQSITGFQFTKVEEEENGE